MLGRISGNYGNQQVGFGNRTNQGKKAVSAVAGTAATSIEEALYRHIGEEAPGSNHAPELRVVRDGDSALIRLRNLLFGPKIPAPIVLRPKSTPNTRITRRFDTEELERLRRISEQEPNAIELTKTKPATDAQLEQGRKIDIIG